MCYLKFSHTLTLCVHAHVPYVACTSVMQVPDRGLLDHFIDKDELLRDDGQGKHD